jgi:hypothetical protein
LRRHTASRLFVREGDVLVACSRGEKMWVWIASFGESYNSDVLQFHKTIIFSQASTNDKILRHEGV